MEEETKKVKEKVSTKVKPIVVVNQLPTVPTRIAMGDDGQEYEMIPAEEALTEILNSVREIKKAVA